MQLEFICQRFLYAAQYEITTKDRLRQGINFSQCGWYKAGDSPNQFTVDVDFAAKFIDLMNQNSTSTTRTR